jgi:UPF0755 protein
VTLRRALLVALPPAGALAIWAAWAALRPYQGYSGEVFVDIPRGDSTRRIAARLEEAGVLRARWPFLAVRAFRPGTTLKAGEYRFDRPLTPLGVYRKIAAGDVFYFTITIPEGYNVYEIAEVVARTGIVDGGAFLDLASRPDRIVDLAPNAPSLEGFLFPDTYRVTRHTTAEELVDQMVRRFREVWSELAGEIRGPAVLEAVTLASLVEEETPRPAERPLVASVFRNRLRIGMALQCDPTVVYALQVSGRYRGEIYKDDLRFWHPYNTYIRPGLPPGPISNPGRASLEAALRPADTHYLYFVADNMGGHVFSADMARHERAVASYRRGQGRKPAVKEHARSR